MHWIDENNKRMEESIKQKKELGLTDKILKRKEGQSWGGKANKGKKQSTETKRILSESHIGMKRSKESVEKSSIGTSKTRWEQTLARLSKQDILDAQIKHGNHQGDTMEELKISFHPYKKLCKHYDIELKKSVHEKSEWVRENQSDAVNVYLYDKTKEDILGEYVGTYYSIAEGCRQLKLPKARPAATMVANHKRPHTNGYVFRKINP
jgi:hypothetical protein